MLMLSVFHSTVAILTGLPTCHMLFINFQGLMQRIWCKHVNPWTFYAQMTLSHCILIFYFFFFFFYLWEKTEIIKFSTTIQELPMAKLNTQSQVLSLHALLYFFVSHSLSVFFFTSPHPFFLHSCSFSSLSPLCSYRAFGCLSSSDRASGFTSWQAVHSKTPGHEDRPTLSLIHTYLCVHAHLRVNPAWIKVKQDQAPDSLKKLLRAQETHS